MVRSYDFWGTFFKNVIVPVSLGVIVFFVYRKIDGRIVVLERDVKGLDLLGKYKNLETRLESNILYNGSITSQLNKNITETSKDVVSLSGKLNQLQSSIVTLDCLEEKLNEMKSSFVTSDCLKEKLSEMKSYINKTLEDFKLCTNSGEVTTGEDDYDEDEDEDYEDGYDDENYEADHDEEEKDYEGEKDVLSAATPVSDGTGENRGSENQECKDNEEDDETKTNIVAEGKSKTESDDENDSDVDNNQYKDLDTGLEEYDGYNDDIFFNDTDNKQKDIITQPHEQIDNKSAVDYNNRDKEVVNLIQSLEQAKSRVDDLEKIVSKYEKGYSLFRLQACFGPSFTGFGKYIGVVQPEKQQQKDDNFKFPFSFFLNLPFSRILPMISYHCLLYKKKGKEKVQGKEEAGIMENHIGEGENGDEIPGENVVNGNRIHILDSLEISPTIFCVSLLRIIKTSLFFLDFGLKIYYPENESDENAKKIVGAFWKVFIDQIFTRFPWCIFLGFNLGHQLLCFFSFSYYDWCYYKQNCNFEEGDEKSRWKNLWCVMLDNFKIEIRLLEVSI